VKEHIIAVCYSLLPHGPFSFQYQHDQGTNHSTQSAASDMVSGSGAPESNHIIEEGVAFE
jgi:hypothetical protein